MTQLTYHWRIVNKSNPDCYSGIELTSGYNRVKRVRKAQALAYPGYYLTRVKRGQYRAGYNNTYLG